MFSTTQTQNPAQMQSNITTYTQVHTYPHTAKIATKPMSLLALTPQTQDLYGLDYTQNTNPHTRVHTKPTTPHTGSPKKSPPQTHHSKPSERKKEKREAEREREEKKQRERESRAEPKSSTTGGGDEWRR